MRQTVELVRLAAAEIDCPSEMGCWGLSKQQSPEEAKVGMDMIGNVALTAFPVGKGLQFLGGVLKLKARMRALSTAMETIPMLKTSAAARLAGGGGGGGGGGGVDVVNCWRFETSRKAQC
jgi:hypothetical protein